MKKTKKTKKPSKESLRSKVKLSNFAIDTAHLAWMAIGHDNTSPVDTIAVAIQMGLEAGRVDAMLSFRTPPVPPPAKKVKLS